MGLEDRRRIEAEKQAELRQKEAVEYTSWREDVVLARRADERARETRQRVHTERAAKLRIGESTRMQGPSILSVPSRPPRPRQLKYTSACAVDLFQASSPSS